MGKDSSTKTRKKAARKEAGTGKKLAQAAGNGTAHRRRDHVAKSITQAVTALFASAWCDETQPSLFGTYQETHLLQKHYSLRWHEVLPPLYEALRQVKAEKKPQQKLGMGGVYSFGLASPGHTPAMLRRIFPRSHIFGFDSFQGLPAEDHKQSYMSNWRKGNLRPDAMTTPERVAASAGGRRWITITPGFYEQTLTKELARELKLGRALYIDIDCDLHSSTSTVLAWLLEHRILRVGTLVGYDDWWTIPCNNFRSSQHKTLLSPLEVFMLTHIGAVEPDTGFKFGSSPKDMAKWMVANPVCASLKDM